ncbi:MAG: leucine-rich repeat domain-containing protein, partial [Clostridia bacterium]|nr:leucine-rich repeat domain-containing protein [Clostridia bacterium]
MKKLLTIILPLLLMLSIAITASAASDSGSCGDNLNWTLDNGVLTISGTGDMTDYTGTNLAPWRSAGESITKVVVQSGVTSIGDRAFSGCKNLLTAELPASVTDIGKYAFQGSGLVQSPLRDGVQVIGLYAFEHCQGIASVTIPGSVKEIGWYAFEGCNNLARVVVESGVKTLSKYMFRDCDVLTSVTIKEGVTTIESYAFAYCYGLKNISIPKSVTKIDGGAFFQATGLKNVYYGGSKSDWEKIYIHTEWEDKHFTEFNNSDVLKANLHLNSAMPPQIAYASTLVVTVDGKKVELQAYALLDEQGNPTNYVKVRDIAYLLNGTQAQFEVEWDGRVKLTKG